VLVEFDDVRSDKYWVDSTSTWQDWDDRYTKEQFEDLFTSLNYTGQRFDGAPIHGSFQSYFKKMSKQDYFPSVTVLNPTSGGYPVWVRLDSSKIYYWNLGWSWGMSKFFTDAKAAAANQLFGGSTVQLTPSSSVKICYIYAGGFNAGINLSPNYNEIAVCERGQGDRDSLEYQGYGLGHIGYFCHEFGHCMGHGHTGALRWNLMHTGHKNGNRHANWSRANAPLVFKRIRLGECSRNKIVYLRDRSCL